MGICIYFMLNMRAYIWYVKYTKLTWTLGGPIQMDRVNERLLKSNLALAETGIG